jgi:hypothetical protein
LWSPVVGFVDFHGGDVEFRYLGGLCVDSVGNENSYRQRKSPAKDGGKTLIPTSRSSLMFEHFVHLIHPAAPNQELDLGPADLFHPPPHHS